MTSPAQKQKKRSKMVGGNLTRLGIDYLEERGWFCVVTEYYDKRTKRTRDLLKFIDVLALKDGFMGVQVTSWDGVRARRKKIKNLKAAKKWLEAGGEIMILSFNSGELESHPDFMKEKVEFITLEDFEDERNKTNKT